jgi:hypothetical protein
MRAHDQTPEEARRALEAIDVAELDELEVYDEACRIAGHYPGPPTFPDALAFGLARRSIARRYGESDAAIAGELEVLSRRCS